MTILCSTHIAFDKAGKESYFLVSIFPQVTSYVKLY